MGKELSRFVGLIKVGTKDWRTERQLATCKRCNQTMQLSKWSYEIISQEHRAYAENVTMAVCVNPTCSRFMLPTDPEWLESDVIINSLAPADGIWKDWKGDKNKFSEMDQQYLAACLRMMYRNPGWRLNQLVQLISWAKYRGVNFEGEFRALADTARQIAKQTKAIGKQNSPNETGQGSIVPPL